MVFSTTTTVIIISVLVTLVFFVFIAIHKAHGEIKLLPTQEELEDFDIENLVRNLSDEDLDGIIKVLDEDPTANTEYCEKLFMAALSEKEFRS